MLKSHILHPPLFFMLSPQVQINVKAIVLSQDINAAMYMQFQSFNH